MLESYFQKREELTAAYLSGKKTLLEFRLAMKTLSAPIIKRVVDQLKNGSRLRAPRDVSKPQQ